MMSVETTVAMIKQACSVMKKAYATLAENAAPAMEQLEAGIGRLTAWEITSYGQDGSYTVTYQDSKPGFWDRVFGGMGGGGVTYKEVPHPRAQEARDAVTALFGAAHANDEKFGASIADIAATPEKLGDIMTTWL